MKKVIFAAAAAWVAATAASATVTVYSSRSVFTAAAGPTSVETFNSITTDTQVTTQGVKLTNFRVYSNTTVGNAFIDAPPVATPYANDSTSYVAAGLNPGTSLFFVFDTPISAFGADFVGLNNALPDGTARSSVFIDGIEVNTPITSSDTSKTFLGVFSDTKFISFRITSLTPTGTIEGVGVDNVTTSVPEPATWAIMTCGFGIVGAAMRRRKPTISFS